MRNFILIYIISISRSTHIIHDLELSRLVQSLFSLLPGMPLGLLSVVSVKACNQRSPTEIRWIRHTFSLKELVDFSTSETSDQLLREGVLLVSDSLSYVEKSGRTLAGCPLFRQWSSYAFIASKLAAPLSHQR